jgi:hypothetical protein
VTRVLHEGRVFSTGDVVLADGEGVQRDRMLRRLIRD